MNAENLKPMILFTKYSPYMVVDLKKLINFNGDDLQISPVMSLCRCGESKFKPYCDGTHSKIGFTGEKKEDRCPDKLKEYCGENITIVDNRGVCCHNASCTTLLPSVFLKDQNPWINPDGASVKEIIETIEKCPSGALSYKIGSRRYQDLERSPEIKVVKNGPLEIIGGILLKDDQNLKPESLEHYTLCRCGASKNKPFCDGEHLKIHFHG